MVGSVLRVSIVTPSFNQAAFVGQMLASVAGQTLQPCEHLIYDHGSTDGALEALQAYVNGNPDAILEVGKDSSQSHAINLGFARSRGDILCWLNTDDWYSRSDTLEMVARRFEEDPELEILYGRGRFVDPDGAVLRDVFIEDDPQRLLATMAHSVGILQPALFMRRRVFERLGPINERLHYCMDYEYWIRASKAGLKFGFIDRFVCNATMHDGAKTVGRRVESLRETIAMIRDQYGFVPVQWLHLLVDAELQGADGILQSSDWQSPQHAGAVAAAFDTYNAGPGAIRAALRFEHPDEILETIEHLKSRVSASDRYVAMAADRASHAACLALINRVRAEADGGVAFVVHDAGLDEGQGEELAATGGVWVLPVRETPAGGLAPGRGVSPMTTFSANLLLRTESWVRDGALLLWLDPGTATGSDLQPLFDLIARQDLLLVSQGRDADPHASILAACSEELATGLAATNRELLSPRLDASFIGLKSGGRFDFLLREACAVVEGLTEWPEVEARKGSPVGPVLAEGNANARRMLAWPECDALSFAELRDISGYVGWSGGEAALSLLAIRHGVRVESRGVLTEAATHSLAGDVTDAPSGSDLAGHDGPPDSSIKVGSEASQGEAAESAEPSSAGQLASWSPNSPIARYARNLVEGLRKRAGGRSRPLSGRAVAGLAGLGVVGLLALLMASLPLDAKAVILASIALAFVCACLFVGYRVLGLTKNLIAENEMLRRDMAAASGRTEALQADLRSDRRRHAAAFDLARARAGEHGSAAAAERERINAAIADRQREIEAIAERDAAVKREIQDLKQAQAELRQLAMRPLGADELAKASEVSGEFAKLWDRTKTLDARIEGEMKRGAATATAVGNLQRAEVESAKARETTDQLAIQAVGRTQYLAADVGAVEEAIEGLSDDLQRMSMSLTALQLIVDGQSQLMGIGLQASGEDLDRAVAQVQETIRELEVATQYDRESLIAVWRRLREVADQMAESESGLSTMVRSLNDRLSLHAGRSSGTGQHQSKGPQRAVEAPPVLGQKGDLVRSGAGMESGRATVAATFESHTPDLHDVKASSGSASGAGKPQAALPKARRSGKVADRK